MTYIVRRIVSKTYGDTKHSHVDVSGDFQSGIVGAWQVPAGIKTPKHCTDFHQVFFFLLVPLAGLRGIELSEQKLNNFVSFTVKLQCVMD